MPTDDARIAERRILRLALGAAASLLISQAVGWPLSFLAPVVTIAILSMPLPGMPIGLCLKFGLAVIVPLYSALLFLPVLLNYPIAGLIVVGVVLFHAYYFAARGGAAVVATLVTISLTVTIAIGSVSIDGVLAVVKGVSLCAVVGIAFAAMSHAVLPDVRRVQPEGAGIPAASIPLGLARTRALRSLAVVLPVVIWFLLSASSAGNAGVMIKVATMGQQASMADTRAAARSLIAATLLGGAAAVIAWQVLSVWPALGLYALLIGTAGLFFGARIFSGASLGESSETWSYAFLTMIIILAPAVVDSPFGAPAGEKFIDRLLMFSGATLYAVAAVFVAAALWPARETGELQPSEHRC